MANDNVCRKCGIWRTVHGISAMLALWFGGVFLSEPPFAITQGIVLLFFVFTIILGIRRFRPA